MNAGTNTVDRYVGAAISVRREAVGLTVDDLASALAVTPQQLQRYESGETRVSASRLFDISQRLGAPVADFFREVSAGEPDGDPTPVAELVRLVSSLSGRRQQMVLDMARSIARAQLAD